jgi:hypothetical protein
MLIVIMLNVIMLNVIIPSVIVLNVVAPLEGLERDQRLAHFAGS